MGNGAELVLGDGEPDYVARLKPLSDTGVEVDILDGNGVSPPKPSVTNMQKWFGP